jgi:hypothetical protein
MPVNQEQTHGNPSSAVVIAAAGSLSDKEESGLTEYKGSKLGQENKLNTF